MCGRTTLLTYDELEEVLEAVERRTAVRIAQREGRRQARPGDTVHAFAANISATGCSTWEHERADLDRSPQAPAWNNSAENMDGKLAIAPYTWGFHLENSGKLVFNTRIESALGGTRMWVGPMRDGRCVLPVASFFEPHRHETVTNPRTGRLLKRHYEFASPDDEPLLLAGIQGGGRLSVVTVEPNASVSPIHDRMPLVLRFEEVASWLDGDFAPLMNLSRPLLLASPEESERDSTQLSLF